MTNNETITIKLTPGVRDALLESHAELHAAGVAMERANEDESNEGTPIPVELYQRRDDAAVAFAEWAETALIDSASSAARQHYIDTGTYLLHGEAMSVDDEPTYTITLNDQEARALRAVLWSVAGDPESSRRWTVDDIDTRLELAGVPRPDTSDLSGGSRSTTSLATTTRYERREPTMTHKNHQTIIDRLTANPGPLIEWAAERLIGLGAKLEWDLEDNFYTTESLVRVGRAYGLPSAGNQSDYELRFYGEAAESLGYETDYEGSHAEDCPWPTDACDCDND